MKVISIILASVLVFGCTTLKYENIEFNDLVGDYRGLSSKISLNEDGTYKTDWTGCYWSNGKTEGIWKRDGNEITLLSKEKTGLDMFNYTKMKIIVYKNNVALLPNEHEKEYKKQLKVYRKSYYVFKKV